MGGVVSAGVDNDDLVDKLKEAGYIKSSKVEKAFRLVDRGYYLTKDNQDAAYRDNAWRQGHLHLSAPCIYAQVMEGLNIGPGMSFLNIGSGTGYLSTMAGLLIGPTGINHGVELQGDVVEYAQERLSWYLLNTGGIDVSAFCEPQFSQGNAFCFKEDTYLYDRVYCGASCPSSHEAYMKNLLKEGGVLVMPRTEKLLKIVRTSKTTWTTESLLPVSFSSLVMPNHALTTDFVELPTVQIVSLQELTREVIRQRFRSCIECENADLREEFIHAIPLQPARERRQRCRPSRTFPHIPISDNEYDSDGSKGSDHDREPFTTHRLQANQITTFLEFARSFNMNRGASDEEELTELQREEKEEEGRSEEEEDFEDNHSNPSESGYMLVDTELDRLELLTAITREVTWAREDPSSSRISTLVETPPEKVPTQSSAITLPEEDAPLGILNNARQDPQNEVMERNENRSYSPVPSSISFNEDEEMIEVCPTEKATSAKGLPNGRKAANKEVKKREKFDSGIVEDMDSVANIEEEDGSCSFHSRSKSTATSSTSSSISDLSEAELEDRFSVRSTRKKTREVSDCACGRNCVCNGGRCKWRTIRCDVSKPDSKQSTDKFSRLMKEKIAELPLPHPLKLYLNYNRPL